MYVYSPDTGELINVTTPAEWMSTTKIAPPAFDPAVSGCFFHNGAWVISAHHPALTDEFAAKSLIDFQQSAQAALSATDTTFSRIQEAITLGLTAATDPSIVAWIDYRKALRAEVRATAVGTLPTKPAIYPAGT
jgi:hypothetical protein